MSETKLMPTWHRGMYGCPQDMYGASVVLPLIAALEAECDRLAAVIEDLRVMLAGHILHNPGIPFWEGIKRVLADADTGAALREHDEHLYALIAGQFTSDIEYDGAEVIGRIRSIQHSLEPHGEGECIVCGNDPEGI